MSLAQRQTLPLNPTLRVALLEFVQNHPQSFTGDIARHLKISNIQAVEWLTQLVDEDLIIGTQTGNQRTQYSEHTVALDEALIKHEYRPLILDAVARNPEMASGLASRLSLPLEEVRETCLFLKHQGVLQGCRVGHALIYRLPEGYGNPQRTASS